MSCSPPVRSVLVLTKYRFMGDTVVAVPLLAAAQRTFPAARITLLTGPAAATILRGCPYVDSLLAFDPYVEERGVSRFLQRMWALRREIRPEICLVANRSFQSALSAVLSGGRIRAGFASEGRGWLLTHPVPYDDAKREVECNLDILRAIAPEGEGPPYDPTPRLWVTDAERKRGATLLQEAAGSLLVGLQPGASYANKQWPAEGFAAVADALSEAGCRIVLIGGQNEIATAREMRRLCRAPVVDLTGATDIRETMGALSHLSLFVGNDTGINHIAAALGVPTVALFGPTSARKWGNAGPHAAVLAAPGGEIERITVKEVITAARGLLKSSPEVVGASG